MFNIFRKENPFNKGWRLSKAGYALNIAVIELNAEVCSPDYYSLVEGFNAATRDTNYIPPELVV